MLLLLYYTICIYNLLSIHLHIIHSRVMPLLSYPYKLRYAYINTWLLFRSFFNFYNYFFNSVLKFSSYSTYFSCHDESLNCILHTCTSNGFQIIEKEHEKDALWVVLSVSRVLFPEYFTVLRTSVSSEGRTVAVGYKDAKTSSGLEVSLQFRPFSLVFHWCEI